MTRCVYVVGTDTEVGKTTVTAHLLRAARLRGHTAAPFKPAASGPSGPQGDPERLLAAASIPGLTLAQICPLRYPEPLAPGLAADPERFCGPRPRTPDPDPLETVADALEALQAHHQPELMLIEAAGGLHVPMPGGTWQLHWIRRLATTTLVVARAGLGTINHTCLTLEALQAAGCPALGFITVEARPPDPSNRDNPAAISTRTGTPHLGTLPYGGHQHAPSSPNADPLSACWPLLLA